MADLGIMQQGKMLGAFTYLAAVNSDANTDEESELVKVFASKLTKAEATLPD